MKIPLHPKYGLNPTIPTCYLCGKGKNEIVFLGPDSKKITGHDEAPMRGPVFDKEPCDKCKDLMKQGVILIEVRDGETGENPHRTGGWWVIKDEAIRRIFQSEAFVDQILKSRVAFIPETAAKTIGLTRKGDKNP